MTRYVCRGLRVLVTFRGYSSTWRGLPEVARCTCTSHTSACPICLPSRPETPPPQVQSGAARTGKWWGHQHFDGMNPDMVIFAKGIASGYPFAGEPAGPLLQDHHCSKAVQYSTAQHSAIQYSTPLEQHGSGTTQFFLKAICVSSWPGRCVFIHMPRYAMICCVGLGCTLASNAPPCPTGIATREHDFDKMQPGTMGGTYGGNAVACAAAVATIQVGKPCGCSIHGS